MSLALEKYFAGRGDRKILSLFITAGYPEMQDTVPVAQLLAEAGADLIELGIPFSDPLADGPTIQEASALALENGVTVSVVLEMAKEMKSRTAVPIILMGYYNPILQFGVDRFIAAAREAGVQGLIIPDLPVEESMALREAATSSGISLIYLVAPNTPAPRLQLIDKLTTSFIYATSITGVTGARQHVADLATGFLSALRRQVRHPVLVGFGVSTPDDVRELSKYSNGVIVGSALIKCIRNNFGKPHGEETIMRFVRGLKNGLREERDGH